MKDKQLFPFFDMAYQVRPCLVPSLFSHSSLTPMYRYCEAAGIQRRMTLGV